MRDICYQLLSKYYTILRKSKQEEKPVLLYFCIQVSHIIDLLPWGPVGKQAKTSMNKQSLFIDIFIYSLGPKLVGIDQYST